MGFRHLPRNLQAYVSMIPELREKMQLNTESSSKNVIYYGPPGTGKTFLVQNGLFAQFTVNSAAKPKDRWLVDNRTMSCGKSLQRSRCRGPASVPSIAIMSLFRRSAQLQIKPIQGDDLGHVTAAYGDGLYLVKYTKRTEPSYSGKC